MSKEAVLVAAKDVAREAANALAGDAELVGEHLGTVIEGDRLVTHRFASNLPGYRGWVWAVTVSRSPRSKEVSICEAHLLPDAEAILAPTWIPWADRLRPSDMDGTQILPYLEDDPRLVPGYQITDDAEEDSLQIWEFGLGRERVLSMEGKQQAAERWAKRYANTRGGTVNARSSNAQVCETCAFVIPLAGIMGQYFGVCANEWSPDDGKVVALNHSCGGHSQTDVEKGPSQWPANEPILDSDALDEFAL